MNVIRAQAHRKNELVALRQSLLKEKGIGVSNIEAELNPLSSHAHPKGHRIGTGALILFTDATAKDVDLPPGMTIKPTKEKRDLEKQVKKKVAAKKKSD